MLACTHRFMPCSFCRGSGFAHFPKPLKNPQTMLLSSSKHVNWDTTQTTACKPQQNNSLKSCKRTHDLICTPDRWPMVCRKLWNTLSGQAEKRYIGAVHLPLRSIWQYSSSEKIQFNIFKLHHTRQDNKEATWWQHWMDACFRVKKKNLFHWVTTEIDNWMKMWQLVLMSGYMWTYSVVWHRSVG